jgi:sugar lactone lactonase YvrE
VHTSTIHPDISGSTPKGFRFSARAFALTAFALVAGFSTRALSAQAPIAVASTTVTAASGQSSGNVATDACGDLYLNANDGSTGVIRISATTGAITKISTNTNGYNGGTGLYMNRAKTMLFFPTSADWYSSVFAGVPITNCTPGAVNNTYGAGITNSGNGYYYGTFSSLSDDAAGNLYLVTSQGNTKQIYEEAYSATAMTYTGSTILSTWPNNIKYVAADAAGDVYFADSTNTVYFYKAGFAAAPTQFSTGYKSIVGLSFDPQGDLFITDGGASIVFEVPLVSGALVASNQYAVASASLVFGVTADAFHNLYTSNYYPGVIKIAVDGVTAPATALGSTSGTFPVNYIFNAAFTPTAITTKTGTAPSTVFSAATGGCTLGTAYAALGTCTVSSTFTPAAIGEQTGGLTLTGTGGSVTTFLSGTGLGAAATIDPGTVVPYTTTLTSPNGVAIDNLGDIFVTDSKANTLTEFIAGSTTGTPVSTGALTLNAPQAVAVDGVGNVYIADTGNNRVVEITAAKTAVALSPALKNPGGVAVDGVGNLYIADTGDNNLLFIPNINGTLAFSSSQSFGTALNGPSAVTVDPANNVYVTETGNNDLLEFPAPLGSSAAVKVAGGLNAPTSLASDASGSVFLVDSGSSSIFRFPNIGGNLGNHTLVGSTLANPTGVAVDAVGNLYATDSTDAIVAEITRVTAALQFAVWNVGTTSTPLTGTVNSSGNQSLTFLTPSYVAGGNTAAGFTVTNDGCAGTTNLPGGSCDITATFTPPQPEFNAQENLTLASNAGNGSPVLQLVGTGAQITASTLSLALTNPAGATSLQAGQAVTFTATIGTNGSTATPSGTIKFYVSGNLVGTQPVANGAASITLPNGLPAGSAVVVSATYSGDFVNDVGYSGSSAQITENVIALPDTLTLTLTPEWNNPNSANDNPANAAGPVVPLMAVVVPSTTTIPTGTVTFYAGTNVLGIKQVLPISTGGYGATLDTTALRSGTTNQNQFGAYLTNYSITATYSGDNTYYPSTSNAAAIAIVGGPITQPVCVTGAPKVGTTPAVPITCTPITGAFYTITPTNPTITATTTTAGGPASGSTTLTLNSYGGYNGILNFTCSGLPKYAACAPYPGYPTVVPSSPTALNTASTVDFIINTNVAPIVPTGSSLIWWFSGFAGFLLLLMRRRIQKMGYLRGSPLFTLLGAVLLLVGSAAGLSGCGSGAYSFVTPAGTSTVNVTVTSAQLLVGSSTGQVQLKDPNSTTFQINLVVK